MRYLRFDTKTGDVWKTSDNTPGRDLSFEGPYHDLQDLHDAYVAMCDTGRAGQWNYKHA